MAKDKDYDSDEDIEDKVANTTPSISNDINAQYRYSTDWYDDTKINTLLTHYIPGEKTDILAVIHTSDALHKTLDNLDSNKLNYIIPLNVSAIDASLNINTNHWVGLYIRRDQDNNLSISYIDPMGRNINDAVKQLLLQRTNFEINQPLLGEGIQYIKGSDNIEIKGNINDCGPMLIYALNCHERVLDLLKITIESVSLELGQYLRKKFESRTDFNEIYSYVKNNYDDTSINNEQILNASSNVHALIQKPEANNKENNSEELISKAYKNYVYKNKDTKQSSIVDWKKQPGYKVKEKLIELSVIFNNEITEINDKINCLETVCNIFEALQNNKPYNVNSKKVVLVGPTGSGKTTFSHYMEGSTLIAKENEDTEEFYLSTKNNNVYDNRNIGNSGYSETFFPSTFTIKGLANHEIFDFAGMGDNNGIFVQIFNHWATKKYFGEFKKAKILFLLEKNRITLKSDEFIKDIILKSVIADEFKSLDESQIKEIAFSFLITKEEQRFLIKNTFDERAKKLSAMLENKVDTHQNIDNMTTAVQNMLKQNAKSLSFMLRAEEEGDYNIEKQREAAVKLIEKTPETDLKYFFAESTFDEQSFVETLSLLSKRDDIIDRLNVYIKNTIKKLNFNDLKEELNYLKTNSDLKDLLGKLAVIYKDQEFINTIEEEINYVELLLNLNKYCFIKTIEQYKKTIYDCLLNKIKSVSLFLNKMENVENIKIITNQQNVLIIKANYIRTNYISKKIKEMHDKINSTEVYCLAINFDSDIDSRSKNLFIKAKNYIISNKKITINLSGVDGDAEQKNGNNAGHFIFQIERKDELDNLRKKLIIKTDGGNGFKGRAGNKGENGDNIFTGRGNIKHDKKSLLSNDEQIQFFDKLLKPSQKDLKNAISFTEIVKSILDRAASTQISISNNSNEEKNISTNNIAISVKECFLNKKKLPAEIKIQIEINYNSLIKQNIKIHYDLDCRGKLMAINQEVYIADYKQHSLDYENKIKSELKEYASSYSDYVNDIVKKYMQNLNEIDKITISKIKEKKDENILTISTEKYMNDDKVVMEGFKKQFITSMQNILEIYCKECTKTINDIFIPAYDDEILNGYKNIELLNNSFCKKLQLKKVSKIKQDDKREQTKIVKILEICDNLLLDSKQAQKFLQSRSCFQWEELYSKLVDSWNNQKVTKVILYDKGTDLNLSASLIRIHNTGYLFHKEEILSISSLNTLAEKSGGRTIVENASGIAAWGGLGGAFGFAAAGIAVGLNFATGGLGLIAVGLLASAASFSAGVTINTKVKELCNFAIEIRSVNNISNSFGQKGKDGENGGDGGNSGIAIFIDSSEKSILYGKIGLAGDYGEGGCFGQNGEIEYLIVARKYKNIYKNDLENKYIQFMHFYAPLPEDYNNDEYKNHKKNSSKHGKKGIDGNQISITEDNKNIFNDFISKEIDDQLNGVIEDIEYISALAGED